MSAPRFVRDVLGALGILAFGAAIGLLTHPEALRASPVGPAAPTDRESFVPANIDVTEARALFEKGRAVFVDARQPDLFKFAHVPGALALYAQPYKPEWRVLRAWLPLDAEVVVVGENASDPNAPRVASQLRMFGVKTTRTLDGGLAAWKAAGLPLSTGWDLDSLMRTEIR